MVERGIASAHPLRWWRIGVWGLAAALLIAAAAASQTVPGFNWTAGDFLGASVLLGAACLSWEALARAGADNYYRAGAALAIGSGLALAWVNLAAGIIGSEDNPANLMFFAVLALGAVGALLAHLRPAGMARTLTAMALVQAVLAVGVMLAGLLAAGCLSLLFSAVWWISAMLFRIASKHGA